MTRPDGEDLESLRVVESADVYKEGWPAATLTRTASGIEFRYLNEWLDRGGPGENFSVVQGLDGDWRVSPAYDLPCSYVFGDKTMAMSIGRRSGGEFTSTDFVGLGATLGVPARAVRGALRDLAQGGDAWLDDLPTLPFDAGQIRKLRRVILHRRDQLTR